MLNRFECVLVHGTCTHLCLYVCIHMCMYACTVHVESVVFKAEEKIEMSIYGMFLGQNRFQ